GTPSATSLRIRAQSSIEITHPICLGGPVFDRRSGPRLERRRHGIARGQRHVQAGALPWGQVFLAVAQQSADLVQRIVLVTPSAQGVLLDPPADLVDDTAAQLHDMERVQDGDGVGQLVTDRVGLAAERVECCLIDPGDPRRRHGS
ncbi:hypothetical protein, partial [Nocardioides bruguierae]|uniref:hypothetical protein n=1 Tax=Nocardioides bruguierae TaxID=2945102 RepID=UPI0020221228